VASRFGRWLIDDERMYRAQAAERALCNYGREILPWVKELSRIEADHKHPVASHRAWIVMAVIGGRLDKGTGSNSVSHTGYIVLAPRPPKVSVPRGFGSLPGFDPVPALSTNGANASLQLLE